MVNSTRETDIQSVITDHNHFEGWFKYIYKVKKIMIFLAFFILVLWWLIIYLFYE